MKLDSGEVFLQSGKSKSIDPVTGLSETVAYSSQDAWLLNATIRENILFGEKYDENRYNSVIRDCALTNDLENFDGGDLTEIGEMGINVSGGQKQRISLARLCYSRASYVLLDDPLSAVDAPTARFLIHKCILGLLKGRTVILVTHATSLLVPFADLVVVIENGEISAQGAPNEMPNHILDVSLNCVSLERDIYDDKKEGYSTGGKIKPSNSTDGTKLIKKEEKSVDSVDMSVYKYYVSSLGIYSCLVILVVLSLETLVRSGSTWWIKIWTEKGEDGHPFFYLGIFTLINVSHILLMYVNYILVLNAVVKASRSIHNALLKSVLYSPLRFFETTPTGRILNRFAGDIALTDDYVADMLVEFIKRGFQAVLLVLLISISSPGVLLIVPIITLAYIYTGKLYSTTSLELKRFDSITRSPIYSQFSETMAGVIVIRAFDAKDRFEGINVQKINQNHKTYMALWAVNAWYQIISELLSTLFLFGVGCTIILADLSPGDTGFILTLSMEFNLLMNICVKAHATMEVGFNAVERVHEYIELEQEPPSIIESKRPAVDWPQHGAIQVRDLKLRYAPELPDVLLGISFDVLANEKLAVVGRTGAGKSTLSLAFFRIVSLSGGSIIIDGENISEIGLSDLRSKLTMISQDPVLFEGDLRSNLDPLGQHDDSELWEAIQRVHLVESFQQNGEKSIMTESFGQGLLTLDYTVEQKGRNFSQGQKQLICMARALLQTNKIIFLDEATASIDNDTDTKIQTTIRSEFADRTIICIAHRLRTIIDYDKVLVLDHGMAVEFGTPLELIETDGTFRSMCEDTGEFDELYEMAKNASSSRPE
jgi:ABC-type multidrug transport system fused ATPase/permease subunit